MSNIQDALNFVYQFLQYIALFPPMKRERNDSNIGSCERAPVPKIYNVVASIRLQLIGTNLRLRQIAAKTSNSQYNPRRFSALIMRIAKPRTTALIFRNGKIIITGSKSEIQTRLAARKIIKKLKTIVGEDKVVWNGDSQICNVVGSVHSRLSIDLQKMVEANNQAQYNPNVFPGLIFRMKNPRVTFLIFGTGKVVITGAKSEHMIEESFLKLYNMLLKYRKQRNI